MVSQTKSFRIDDNKIQFEKGRQEVPEHIRGKCCFITNQGIDEIRNFYGRPKAWLKIFFNEGFDTWGDPEWGGYGLDRNREIGRVSYLKEATVIQNLCWMAGDAPRVYALLEVERDGKKYPAQLIEYLEPNKVKVDINKQLDDMEEYLGKFRVRMCHRELLGQHDFIDGKLIDFQGFTFKSDAEEAIVNYVKKYGKYGKSHYQSIDAVGLTAKPRDTKQRVKEMGLKKLDFEGKDVLDIGSNLGAFCMYAADQGAKRVVGIDLPDEALASKVLAFYLGYHNIDYFGLELGKNDDNNPLHNKKFDIVFYLSMVAHIGIPKWLGKVTKETLIFEVNAMGSKFKTEQHIDELQNDFKSIELYGKTTDHNPEYPKPILIARK